MKTSLLRVPIVLCLITAACAEDAVSPTVLDEAGEKYLEAIDKAEQDYLNEVRLALRKTTAIEVSRIAYPGSHHPDPFEDDSDQRFVEAYLGWGFKVLETKRIEKAKEVTDFLNATIYSKGGDILMFPYVPSIGFRCYAGESAMFTATIDLKSYSMRIVFPDGQYTRLGLDLRLTLEILKSQGIKLPQE